jgi:hypothetical protein
MSFVDDEALHVIDALVGDDVRPSAPFSERFA